MVSPAVLWSARCMNRRASSPAFTRFAWGCVAYLIAVILFGAWVRITHSGAGCGSHWPTCNGDIVPLAPSLETIIEYTHRLTIGFLGILGLVLVGWSVLRHGRHRVTVAAIVTLAFIVVEALIGAGLVLRELVADDDSVARAIVISIHLVNTLVLTGAAVLTAWWSFDERAVAWRALGSGRWLLIAGFVAIIVTSMTGAVTALGDTLFPVMADGGPGVIDRLAEDLSPAKHFLVRLRVLHPVVAVLAAGVLLWMATWVRDQEIDPVTTKLAKGLRHTVVTQVVIGFVNIALHAPGWMQLVHLLLAQGVWMMAVLTAVSAAAGAGRRSQAA